MQASSHLTSTTGMNIPVSLPAADTTFSLSSGQTHVIANVPVGAVCSITEVNARRATP